MQLKNKYATISILVGVLVVLTFGTLNSLCATEPSMKKSEDVVVIEKPEGVSIENELVRVDLNLKTGTYSVVDVRDGTVAIANAHGEVDGLGADPQGFVTRKLDPKAKLTWKVKAISDLLGEGKMLILDNLRSDSREFFTTFTVYSGKGFIALGSGIINNRPYAIRVKSFQPMAGGNVFPGLEMKDARNLNGGAGSTKNLVQNGTDRACENSLLLTFKGNGQRCSLVMGGLTYQDFAKYTAIGRYECWDMYPDDQMPELGQTWRTIWRPMDERRIPANFPALNAQVAAVDPVGHLVDPGTTYQPNDLFYVDVTTADPFLALEIYGRALAAATKSHPNTYNNLTVCGWFSGRNSAKQLVEEMDVARRLDMLKTIPVAVRLEPDTYCGADNGNTEQGWWDDAHWLKYKHLTPPYDTFKKWIQAVKERGGTTETYFQCGMPSDDYAEAFPGHMLRNDISSLHRRHAHIHPLVTYDATDPGFQSHMRNVWAYLKEAGLGGVKFDYPDIAWRPEGGFEDKYATTASAYRTWFQLCREGLGPEALIHERALGENCLDVTAGIVDLQRVWGDADKWQPGMASICGLRWYKNRVVMSYYPDSKAFTGFNEKGRRMEGVVMEPLKRQAIITMLYVTSGRIESAASLNLLTPEVVHDLGRAFPMHSTPQSARPVDAFTGIKSPRVYSFRINDQWQQVTFYNDGDSPATISAPLSGDQVSTGSLGLDANKSYYVYEFWSNRLIGKLSGAATLQQSLAGGEARMFSVREVLNYPQVLSTNRHLMQGYVDLADVKWDADKRRLSGIAKAVGGEPFKIVLARNGVKARNVSAKGARVKLEAYPSDPNLSVLVLERPDNGDVFWQISY
ncbi:MAG: hypothetical protein WC699_18445 [Bacteroidales bacterium]|jgi:hypothetical protein